MAFIIRIYHEARSSECQTRRMKSQVPMEQWSSPMCEPVQCRTPQHHSLKYINPLNTELNPICQ